jgi:hypothetical protein
MSTAVASHSTAASSGKIPTALVRRLTSLFTRSSGLVLHTGVGAADDLVDERLVNLEDVDRQAAQVGKRGVAGAEVVDR